MLSTDLAMKLRELGLPYTLDQLLEEVVARGYPRHSLRRDIHFGGTWLWEFGFGDRGGMDDSDLEWTSAEYTPEDAVAVALIDITGDTHA